MNIKVPVCTFLTLLKHKKYHNMFADISEIYWVNIWFIWKQCNSQLFSFENVRSGTECLSLFWFVKNPPTASLFNLATCVHQVWGGGGSGNKNLSNIFFVNPTYSTYNLRDWIHEFTVYLHIVLEKLHIEEIEVCLGLRVNVFELRAVVTKYQLNAKYFKYQCS